MVSTPGSVEVLRAVRETGLPCYALTNMEAETYPLRLERFPFLGWFDGTVVSGREGMAKPDPDIFMRLLDRFGLTAGDDVDDRRHGGEPRRRRRAGDADHPVPLVPPAPDGSRGRRGPAPIRRRALTRTGRWRRRCRISLGSA